VADAPTWPTRRRGRRADVADAPTWPTPDWPTPDWPTCDRRRPRRYCARVALDEEVTLYQKDGGSDAQPLKEKEGFAIGGGTIAFILIAAAIVIFIAQNTNDVDVDFLFLDGQWPLWIVVVAVVVLTLIAERLGLWVWRRSRKKD
jgi:uncharacterized integral membrane protein